MVSAYVNTQKIAPLTSNVFMIGLQFEGSINNTTPTNRLSHKEGKISRIGIAGLILNDTVFVRLRKDLVIGLEMQIYIDANKNDSYIAFYPQIHVPILPVFQLQMGFGFVFTKEGFIPQLVHRATISQPESLE